MSNAAPSKTVKFLSAFWIFFNVVLYILVNGGSPYIKSFFMAGYLK